MDNFGVMNSMFTIGSNHSDSDYLGPSASQIGGSGPGSSSSSSTLPGSSASHSRRDLLDSVSRRATASILDDTIHRRILEDIDKACNEAIEQVGQNFGEGVQRLGKLKLHSLLNHHSAEK